MRFEVAQLLQRFFPMRIFQEIIAWTGDSSDWWRSRGISTEIKWRGRDRIIYLRSNFPGLGTTAKMIDYINTGDFLTITM